MNTPNLLRYLAGPPYVLLKKKITKFMIIRLLGLLDLCICILTTVHHVCPQRPEEGTGVMDDCEPAYGCLEPNLGPLQDQQWLTPEHLLPHSLFCVLLPLKVIMVSGL